MQLAGRAKTMHTCQHDLLRMVCSWDSHHCRTRGGRGLAHTHTQARCCIAVRFTAARCCIAVFTPLSSAVAAWALMSGHLGVLLVALRPSIATWTHAHTMQWAAWQCPVLDTLHGRLHEVLINAVTVRCCWLPQVDTPATHIHVP